MTSTDLSSLLFFAIPVGFIAYIFMGQRRRMRALQELHASIVAGDQVRTTSGLFGQVTAVTDTEVHLLVAPGVVLRFDRRAVDAKVAAAPTSDESTSDGPTGDGPTDGASDDPARGE